MRAKMTPPLEPLPLVEYMFQHLAGGWVGGVRETLLSGLACLVLLKL
jgi:hypothetical protein